MTTEIECQNGHGLRCMESPCLACRVELLAEQWERDEQESLNTFGQHLMGGAVAVCAEQLRAVLDVVTSPATTTTASASASEEVTAWPRWLRFFRGRGTRRPCPLVSYAECHRVCVPADTCAARCPIPPGRG